MMVRLIAGKDLLISSKSAFVRRTRSLSRTATTVAIRLSPERMAISPTISPRKTAPMTLSSSAPSWPTTRRKPWIRKYRPSASSPAEKSVSPRFKWTQVNRDSMSSYLARSISPMVAERIFNHSLQRSL